MAYDPTPLSSILYPCRHENTENLTGPVMPSWVELREGQQRDANISESESHTGRFFWITSGFSMMLDSLFNHEKPEFNNTSRSFIKVNEMALPMTIAGIVPQSDRPIHQIRRDGKFHHEPSETVHSRRHRQIILNEL
jgi:hypothetical protein